MCRFSEVFVVEAVEGGAKVLSHPVYNEDNNYVILFVNSGVPKTSCKKVDYQLTFSMKKLIFFSYWLVCHDFCTMIFLIKFRSFWYPIPDSYYKR